MSSAANSVVVPWPLLPAPHAGFGLRARFMIAFARRAIDCRQHISARPTAERPRSAMIASSRARFAGLTWAQMSSSRLMAALSLICGEL